MTLPKVSYSDLEEAFTFASLDHHYWLDRQTGEIIAFESEIARALERGEDLSCAPEWQHEMIAGARRVLRTFGELPEEEGKGKDDAGPDRYARISGIESGQAYQMMVDFVETVWNARLCELLEVALRGQGAFRRFKDVLLDYPAERERWFEFEKQCVRELIIEWAGEENVEIDFSR